MSEENRPIFPPTLNQAIKADKKNVEYKDCLSCRLTGSAAFVGLGTYTYISGHNQLRHQRAKILKSGSQLGLRGRGFAITGLSAVLVGMGVYRGFN